MTPLPHIGLQSLSVIAFAPLGQQPSPLLGAVTVLGMHVALQFAALPINTFELQPEVAPQALGQLPSHVSPLSTTPLPHTGLQSLSLFALPPGGQQPSPFVGAVIGECVQTALHCAALPVVMSVVQPFPSSHEVAHGLSLLDGSQVSAPLITPSPQLCEQSVSEL
jgi:hypothetical protein